MNPCLFQSPAGAASTFEQILDPPQCSPHCIPHHLALSACGWFIGNGLTDSHGSHPLWASPSLTLCPYYSRSGSACQGVFQKFLKKFLSSPRYLTLWGGTARACISRLPTRFLAMVVIPFDTNIISHLYKNRIANTGKFYPKYTIRGRLMFTRP